MSAVKPLYAVYNKDCGHLAHIANARSAAGELIAALTVAGKWGWRIKADPTDEDIASLLRGDRCEVCTLDAGTEADGSILFVGKPGSAT